MPEALILWRVSSKRRAVIRIAALPLRIPVKHPALTAEKW